MNAPAIAWRGAVGLLQELCDAQGRLTGSLQRGDVDDLPGLLEEQQSGVARLSACLGPDGRPAGAFSGDPEAELFREKARRLRRLNGVNEMLARTRLAAVEAGLRALEMQAPPPPLYGPAVAAAPGQMLKVSY
jgi:hypothetical protein